MNNGIRYVTACPQCSTAFYISPEQLSAHEGDVRCSKCSHVFNAHERLVELPEKTGEVTSSDKFVLLEDDTSAEFTVEEEAVPETAPDFQVEELPADSTEPVLTFGEETATVVEEIEIGAPEEPPVAQEEQPTAAEEPAIAENIAASIPFAESAAPKARHPWLGWLLAFLLLLAAGLQAIYYLRTPMAAQWPALKPYLVQVCGFLNCTVELPRKINLILLDDSNMQEDPEHEGLIELTSMLVNQAPYAQAYPNLELSLTDIHDTAILRRTLSPQEYLPAGKDIAAGIGAGEEIHIKLDLTASGEPVAGYRILATYH